MLFWIIVLIVSMFIPMPDWVRVITLIMLALSVAWYAFLLVVSVFVKEDK